MKQPATPKGFSQLQSPGLAAWFGLQNGGQTMGNLIVDPLAIAALVGFGVLLLITIGITVWLIRKAGKAPGER